MDAERALFLAVALLTHGLVGYALVRAFTDANPAVGFVLGIGPDADFLFPAAWGAPFVHRGITHTGVFVVAVVAATVLYSSFPSSPSRLSSQLGPASGLAIGSHLVIDSCSPEGVSWLFPLGIRASGDLPVHGPTGTLVLWGFSIGVLVWRG